MPTNSDILNVPLIFDSYGRVLARRRFLLLQFWEQEKVTGEGRSGEYSGCGNIIVLFLAKNSRTSNDVCAKANFCSSTSPGVSGGLLRENCA